MVISRASCSKASFIYVLHLRGRKRKHYAKANKANQNEKPPTSYTYALCQYFDRPLELIAVSGPWEFDSQEDILQHDTQTPTAAPWKWIQNRSKFKTLYTSQYPLIDSTISNNLCHTLDAELPMARFFVILTPPRSRLLRRCPKSSLSQPGGEDQILYDCSASE